MESSHLCRNEPFHTELPHTPTPTDSAKLQATVKKALRDWFEAARNGSGGVPCVVLVDAVITLGLNQDLKQVTPRLLHYGRWRIACSVRNHHNLDRIFCRRQRQVTQYLGIRLSGLWR